MVHGISIKPGKPTIVGKIGSKMVFGLPGHPAASAILFEVLVKPYLFCLQQRTDSARPLHAKITSNLHASPGKDQFLPVTLKRETDGYHAVPMLGKSGIMSLISKADGYIRISSETEGLYKGQPVEVHPFGGGGSNG
jgi:molybdopterin molybdotransferase